MASIDWIIVTLYCGVLIVVAWAFHRRAGHSIDAYFVADRKLPWWIIGLSDTAAYTGGGQAFLMVFFLGGFSGFWLMGWITWVIWMEWETGDGPISEEIPLRPSGVARAFGRVSPRAQATHEPMIISSGSFREPES